MIRWIARFIGLGFAAAVLWAFGSNLITNIQSPPAATAEDDFHRHPKGLSLKSDGLFGKFDEQQPQRGFRSTRSLRGLQA
jgi:ubiquinol-cytochrome c reductase cytochrome c1 subunit